MNQVEVLFVEDSAGDALLTQQVLAESLPRVKLHIARDGEQALAMLADLLQQREKWAFPSQLLILLSTAD